MSVKAIPTTSLAKTKEERKSLRRAVLDHGSTDADAIEDKRQHSALQLIKLGETVNKLGRQRILMEEQGEKRIAEMREEALSQLIAFPLLRGYRGSAPRDLTALIDLIMKLSDFIAAHGNEIAEVELNPVIVRLAGQGVVVVESLIRLNSVS